jgi:hypothetical protein
VESVVVRLLRRLPPPAAESDSAAFPDGDRDSSPDRDDFSVCESIPDI